MKRFLLVVVLACVLLVTAQPSSAQCLTSCTGGNVGTAVHSIPTQATKPIDGLTEYALILALIAIVAIAA